MDHMLFFLLFCLLKAVSYAAADGVKIVSVMDGEFNTNMSDLPIPKITRKYQPCSSESSRLKCVLKCSTKNAPDATLSWYNGSRKVAHTENSDLNIEPSVSLEVQYQDKNTYSCVINNPISNQTTHLDITQHCQLCADMSMTQVPVMEGDSVTLHSNFTDIQKKDEILWMFGFQKNLIAEIFKNIVSLYDCNNGTLQNRLLLDRQTGHLTITNTSKEICGYYKLQNDSIPSRCWGFNITVYARLPVPVITKDTSQSSRLSRCALLCSVFNVSHVTLSWYKGISVLSSIRASDLNISLSLPLEVEYQDNNTYSCVVSYSFTNKTQQLDITGLCSEPLPSPQISNHSHHCPSSGSECVLECSVENVTKGNLAWYKENRLLSSISVSDLNYLCLDLDYKNNGNYSCVVFNSFINETKYLIISELCSVQSNNLILIICLTLAVVVVFIASILGLWLYKRKQARQDEAASQTVTSQNSPAEASSNATDRNAENEQRPLIDSSSSTDTSQSIPLCCR